MNAKLPIGTRVFANGGLPHTSGFAVVKDHGRDSAGVYTEVAFEDESKGRLRIHRSNLKLAPRTTT